MSIFCRHDYKLISETTTKSKFEHASEFVNSVELQGYWDVFNRKHIQVFTCSKCGNLKRFVENI